MMSDDERVALAKVMELFLPGTAPHEEAKARLEAADQLARAEADAAAERARIEALMAEDRAFSEAREAARRADNPDYGSASLREEIARAEQHLANLNAQAAELATVVIESPSIESTAIVAAVVDA